MFLFQLYLILKTLKVKIQNQALIKINTVTLFVTPKLKICIIIFLLQIYIILNNYELNTNLIRFHNCYFKISKLMSGKCIVCKAIINLN